MAPPLSTTSLGHPPQSRPPCVGWMYPAVQMDNPLALITASLGPGALASHARDPRTSPPPPIRRPMIQKGALSLRERGGRPATKQGFL